MGKDKRRVAHSGLIMRILIAIANYGVKNIEYAKRVIREYRAMPFDVDIFVLSEAAKDYGDDAKVIVGLPSPDPWSLPFDHKKLFAENAEHYDLYIYAEDDTLIRTENVLAYMKASDRLGPLLIPGFVRYELDENGQKNYPDVYSHYHWLPGSVNQMAEYTFARFSNDHAACYMLTQRQLERAMASGGFLVSPHSGRYDMICSAGTDPYTQCGFTRVVCFSHLPSFEVHHLSNIYVNRVGLDEASYHTQLEALGEIRQRHRSTDELLVSEKPIPTSMWDKSYYEPCRHDIVSRLPKTAAQVLSVGCGWGATEALLASTGRRVTAVPLDSVISRLCEKRGIRVLPPNLQQAISSVNDRRFDAIVLSEVLQHVSDPVTMLARLRTLLKHGGIIVGSIPNLSPGRRLTGRALARDGKFDAIRGDFDQTRLNLTSATALKRWMQASRLKLTQTSYDDFVSARPWSRLTRFVPRALCTRNILFTATR